MRCSFTLSRADFAALHKVVNRRLANLSGASTKVLFLNLLIWVTRGIAFAACAALFLKYPAMTYDLTVVAIALCVGIALMIGGAYSRQHTYHRAMLSPEGWFLAEQTVDLGPEGLSVTGAWGMTHCKWSSFRHVVEDDVNLYRFIDNAQAFVLPKAVLGSSDQLAQVTAWLQS